MFTNSYRFGKLGSTAALYVSALLIVAAVRIALTVSGYRGVLRTVPDNLTLVAPDPMVWRASRAVTLMARLIPKASCLTQALALQLMLGYRGYLSELQIGVKQDETGVAAHAWLLSNGRIAIGGSPQDVATYVPITVLRGRKA